MIDADFLLWRLLQLALVLVLLADLIAAAVSVKLAFNQRNAAYAFIAVAMVVSAYAVAILIAMLRSQV